MSSLSLSSPLVAIPVFTALVFLIVASPVTFKFTAAKIGAPLKIGLITPAGLPTRSGLVLHAIVAALIVYAYLRAYSPEASLY